MRALALDAAPEKTAGRNPHPEGLLSLGGAAWQLACRVLGGSQDADDVVQQAYANAYRNPPPELPPDELRAWFFRVVANAAKNHLVGEARRRRREAAMIAVEGPAAREDAELVALLRGELDALDEKYRVPLALCYEQGLSQRHAAQVLEMPVSTLSKYVNEGLEELRSRLSRAGYAAAPAAVMAGLAHTAPAVPAALAAALEKIVGGHLAVKGTGAAATAAVKGGIAMKIIVSVLAAGVLAGGVALVGSQFTVQGSQLKAPPTTVNREPGTVNSPPAGSNPVTGRQDREEVFEFAEKPKVAKQGDKVVITFASKGKCDATVAIVGPDGKIVRHLASGVLGKNAPWPFKQDSLSQLVEWDGKDDAGKPAPAGCKVKVGLGLKASYDRLLAREPALLGFRPGGLVCDSEGNVYCLIQNQGTTIYALDREGRYLRTVAPFPGHLPSEKLPGIEFTERVDGVKIPLNTKGGSIGYCFYKCQTGGGIVGDSPISLSSDGKGLFFVGRTNGNWALLRAGIDGSLGGPPLLLNYSQQYDAPPGPNMVVGPDGASVYWTGNKADRAAHTVLCQKMEALTACNPNAKHKTPPAVFIGEANKPGSDDAHLNDPQGLVFDAAGNLYVADRGNNRVQVFGADGKFLRSCAAKAPWKVQVHPRTGDVYVLCEDWAAKKTSVVKFGKDGKPAGAEAALAQDKAPPYGLPSYFCLDASGPEPAVWTCDAQGLKKFVERGGKLEKVLDFGEERKKNWAGWDLPPHPLFHGHQWMAADPYREEIYLREGGTCEGSPIYRIDGRTGKLVDKPSTYKSSEVHVGPDRLAYMRVEMGMVIMRFDPATGKAVPFEKGNTEWDFRGQKVKAIRTVAKGGGRTFQDGIGVAPNGDIYVVIDEVPKAFQAELEKIGQAKNMKSPGSTCGGALVDFLQVFGPDGAAKHISAIPGLVHSNGVRVARNGNVVLNAVTRKAGLKVPDGIVPGKPSYGYWGTLICFDSAFDKFPVGFFRGTWDTDKLSTPPTHVGSQYSDGPIWIDPIRWDFGGVSPSFSYTGGCVCQTSRCDLDGFDRSFAPAAHLMAVNVLDSNGNLIARVGRYGNADSRGADSAVPDPKTGLLRTRKADDPADLKPPKELAEEPGFYWAPYVAVTDEALYVNDQGNSRIVRCALSYRAEETAPAP